MGSLNSVYVTVLPNPICTQEAHIEAGIIYPRRHYHQVNRSLSPWDEICRLIQGFHPSSVSRRR